MTAARIPHRLLIERSLTSLNLAMTTVTRSQEQCNSGQLVNRPSDSITDTNIATQLRQQLAADTQHSRNATDGLAYLGQTHSTMTSMLDQVRKVRELMLQGASTGTAGPEARAALASEVSQLRQSLLGLANTRYLDRSIFAGTSGAAAAYAPDGSFLGDTNAVQRRVGTGKSVRVNLTGPEAFSANGENLFTITSDVVTRLTSSPNDLDTSMSRLDAVAGKMRRSLADVGSRYARIEKAMTTLANTTLDNTAALSSLENVDTAKAAIDLQLQEVAYQVALGATARVISPSLLDFLR